MAKQNNLSPLMVMIFFNIGTIAMFMNSIPAGLALNPAPSPSPSPSPSTDYEHLAECSSKLSNCGDEIYLGIFQGGEVTDYCCAKLVSAGKLCQHDLVQYVVTGPRFQGNVAEVLKRSDQVWNDCAVLAPASYNPSSL